MIHCNFPSTPPRVCEPLQPFHVEVLSIVTNSRHIIRMASLLHLPLELLDIVLQRSKDFSSIRFCSKDGKLNARDLASVSLVCHGLRDMAQKQLYSTFTLLKRSWRLRAFTHTLCTRPDLAVRVKSVWLDGWSSFHSAAWDLEELYVQGAESRSYTALDNLLDFRDFHQATKTIDPPNKRKWRQAIKKNVDEVYLAIMLQLLPNLSDLHLEVPPGCDFLTSALDEATTITPSYTGRPFLPNLKFVILNCSTDVMTDDIRRIQPFLSLPLLQSISVCGWVSRSDQCRSWTMRSRSCSATKLDLSSHYITPNDLEIILQSFIGLKILKFNQRPTVPFNRAIRNSFPIGQPLAAVQTSLEHLELGDHVAISGSLRHLTNLKSFYGGFDRLVNPDNTTSLRLVEVLPISIESLTFVDLGYSNWIQQRDQITELTGSKIQGNHRCLHRVAASDRAFYYNSGKSSLPYPPDLVKLCRLGEAAGVTIWCQLDGTHEAIKLSRKILQNDD